MVAAAAARSTSAAPPQTPSGAGLAADSAETRRRIQGAVTDRDRISQRVKQLLSERENTVAAEAAQPLKIIDLPEFEPIEGRPNESLSALQEWEGFVVDVGDGAFRAELVDIAKRQPGPEELAEIPITEVSPDDRNRVVPGALFRWVIGYTRKASGRVERSALIYFRRNVPPRQSMRIPDLVFAPEDDS
jgi:hypothetical protein